MFSRWLPVLVIFSAGWLFGEFSEDVAIANDRHSLLTLSGEPILVPSSRLMPFPRSEKKVESPQDTVENIHSRSNELSEPSRTSEERYVRAIRTWLNTLAPIQREKARKIMVEAHPALQSLRDAIRHKKLELASLSFDKGMPPETLPRLGMELQKLRASLNKELKKINDKLLYEAGIHMDSSNGESFWLFPPEETNN